MEIFKNIRRKIINYIIQKATADKTIDIIEVRTKSINLTYVNLETDIKINNAFFLPIKILEISADIVNTSGLRVGALHYNQIRKIKAHKAEVFTTHTQLSNITALFNLISKLLTLSIKMRSIGTAKIKVLWFEVEIPVDDIFEIKSHQLKIIGELTPEEKAEENEKRRLRKEAYKQKRAAKKERHTAKESRKSAETEYNKQTTSEDITDSSSDDKDSLNIYINNDAIKEIERDLDKESESPKD